MYCLRCRKRTRTENVHRVCITGKAGNRRPAESGRCAVCETKKVRFLRGSC